MVLIALTGLFVIRFGPRPRYIGLAVLLAGFGLYMGLRHSSLHLWRDVGQGFSAEILGAHTYTWSMFIYWVCVVMMGALLLMLKDGEGTRETRRLRPRERLTLWLFLAAAAGNAVQAFASTGPPPYMGQSDPVRFSFNPSNWVWSTEEWTPAPVSLRGPEAGPEAQAITSHHHLGLALLYRELGNAENFAQHWQAAEELGKHTTLVDWPHRWCLAQARLKESEGDFDAALDLLDEAKRVYVKNPVPDLRPIEALKTRIYLKRERLDKVQAWVTERRLSVGDEASYMPARIRTAHYGASVDHRAGSQ